MKSVTLKLPQIALIAGTRALLGAGIALLLADKLEKDERRIVGFILTGIGVLSTIPLAAEIFDEL